MAQAPVTRLFPENQDSHPPRLPVCTLNDKTHALHLVLVLKDAGFPPEAKSFAHGDAKNPVLKRFLKGVCILGTAHSELTRYNNQPFKYHGFTIPRAVYTITAVPNAEGKTVAYVLTLFVNSIEMSEANKPAAAREEKKRESNNNDDSENDPQPPPDPEESAPMVDDEAAAPAEEKKEEGDDDGVIVAEDADEPDDENHPDSKVAEGQEGWFDAEEDRYWYQAPNADNCTPAQLARANAMRAQAIRLERPKRCLGFKLFKWMHSTSKERDEFVPRGGNRNFVQSLTETTYMRFFREMVPNLGGEGGVDQLEVIRKSILNPTNPATLINLFSLNRALVALELAGAAPEFYQASSWLDEKTGFPRLPGLCFFEQTCKVYGEKFVYKQYGERSWLIEPGLDLGDYLFPDFPRPAPDKDDPKWKAAVAESMARRWAETPANLKIGQTKEELFMEAAIRDATYQWHATLNPLEYQMDSQKRMLEKMTKKLTEARVAYRAAREQAKAEGKDGDAKHNLSIYTAFSERVDSITSEGCKEWDLWVNLDYVQSESQRACRDFLGKMIKETDKGSFSVPWPKMYANTSTFAEIMIRLAAEAEVVERNFATHGQAVRTLVACFELWLPTMLHLHTLLMGNHSQGKSFVQKCLKLLLIELTYMEMAGNTDKERYAVGAGNQKHKKINLWDELTPSMLGMSESGNHAGKYGAAEQATTDKAANIRASMTAPDVNGYSRLEKDEKTGKYVRTVFKEVIDELIIGNVNLRVNQLPANMKSRYNIEDFPAQVREMTSIISHVAQSQEMDEEALRILKPEIRTWVKRLQAGCWLLGSQMETGNLELYKGVSSFYFEIVFRMLNDFGMTNIDLRETQRMQGCANALACLNIQSRLLDICVVPPKDKQDDPEWKREFGHLTAPLLNKKVDFATVTKAAQPICYVGIEEAVFACTAARDHLESPVTEDVLKAIYALLVDRRIINANDQQQSQQQPEAKGNAGGKVMPGQAYNSKKKQQQQQQQQPENKAGPPSTEADFAILRMNGLRAELKRLEADKKMSPEDKARATIDIKQEIQTNQDVIDLYTVIQSLKTKKASQLQQPEPGSDQEKNKQTLLNKEGFAPPAVVNEEDANPYFTILLSSVPQQRAGSLPPREEEVCKYFFNEFKGYMKKHAGNYPDVLSYLLRLHEKTIEGSRTASKLLVLEPTQVRIAKSLLKGALASSLVRLCNKLALVLPCMPKKEYLFGLPLAHSPWMYETFCNDPEKLQDKPAQLAIYNLLVEESKRFMIHAGDDKYYVPYTRSGFYEEAMLQVIKTFRGKTEQELQKHMDDWVERGRQEPQNTQKLFMDRDVEQFLVRDWLFQQRGMSGQVMKAFWPRGIFQHKEIQKACSHLPRYPDAHPSRNEIEYRKMLDARLRRKPEEHKASNYKLDPGIEEMVDDLLFMSREVSSASAPAQPMEIVQPRQQEQPREVKVQQTMMMQDDADAELDSLLRDEEEIDQEQEQYEQALLQAEPRQEETKKKEAVIESESPSAFGMGLQASPVESKRPTTTVVVAKPPLLLVHAPAAKRKTPSVSLSSSDSKETKETTVVVAEGKEEKKEEEDGPPRKKRKTATTKKKKKITTEEEEEEESPWSEGELKHPGDGLEEEGLNLEEDEELKQHLEETKGMDVASDETKEDADYRKALFARKRANPKNADKTDAEIEAEVEADANAEGSSSEKENESDEMDTSGGDDEGDEGDEEDGEEGSEAELSDDPEEAEVRREEAAWRRKQQEPN